VGLVSQMPARRRTTSTRHADDLNRRDSMNFFALADRTSGVIIE
jgi:hypothetical protein